MNDRIRELMIQSNPHGDFTDSEWVFKKFAELIVEDCLFKIRVEAAQYLSPDWRDSLVNNIKEHFGVDDPKHYTKNAS